MRRRSGLPAPPVAAHVDWAAVRQLIPYLGEFPGRLAVAVACLVAAKLAGVTLPMVLGAAVDSLDADGREVAVVVPVALLLGYGLLRFAGVALGELRDVIFSRVSERAMRRVALRVFEHLHLSLIHI